MNHVLSPASHVLTWEKFQLQIVSSRCLNWYCCCTFHNNNELIEWLVNVNILCKWLEFLLQSRWKHLCFPIIWKQGENSKGKCSRRALIETSLMPSSFEHLEKTKKKKQKRRELLRRSAYFLLPTAVIPCAAGFKGNWGA